MKKVILGILTLLLSAVIISFLLKEILQTKPFSNRRNNSLCKTEKFGRAEFFSGIIVKKYLDRKNHSNRTIKFKNNNDIKESILFALDSSGAYDFLIEGDSIVKNKGELRVRIYRDSVLNEFNIDYGCKH
ncbi:hypothetical protein LVD17_09850 [Fulvivirga ulvae]|uniref:hypothetical protein n=1 Tax=Fulvivirga ulvae TaxID=2904245 RepID=UPI001F322A6F|nr:hypothetical protein [Fulvivirga ulvae]UII34116.1 hypothetical protein LVD17_09850 [Fulvivirga ulvae]